MMMNPTEMSKIRKDLNFIIDSLKHLRPRTEGVLITALGAVDNQLIDVEDRWQGRVNEKKPESPFTIQINEYQRKLIERALHWTEGSPKMTEILVHEEGDNFENKLVELQTLRAMFNGLIDVNTSEMLHGFCL